jgi:uncharacterized protein (DUF2342 family)
MDHTVGYVLLGSAAVPAIIGWSLALRGLSQVETAAKSAKSVADAAAKQVADAHQVTAEATPPQATAVADATRAASAEVAGVQDAVNGVNDALKELTGRFAPARVAFALATLLVVAALFALGILSASAGTGSSGSTTTSTSPRAPTP